MTVRAHSWVHLVLCCLCTLSPKHELSCWLSQVFLARGGSQTGEKAGLSTLLMVNSVYLLDSTLLPLHLGVPKLSPDQHQSKELREFVFQKHFHWCEEKLFYNIVVNQSRNESHSPPPWQLHILTLRLQTCEPLAPISAELTAVVGHFVWSPWPANSKALCKYGH